MKIDGDLAELMGIHIGDGCISKNKRYEEYYLGGDLIEEKEYHDNWVGPLFNNKIMLPLFGKRVNYKEHPKVGVYAFHIFDKKLVSFFEGLGISSGSKINLGIPKCILKNSFFIKRFLRGLFDTDGNLYFDRNRSAKNPINDRPTIKLGTVSKPLIDDIFRELKKMNFNPRIKKPYKGKKDKNVVHTILIYRIRDIERYLEEIGFKNPKHYSKWELYKKFGYCSPHTTLAERKLLLKNAKAL
jgi:intein/homing endonuclease